MKINSISRIDFAREQLEVSIELFLSARSFASALTLAGAAEEIFGKLLVLKEQSNSLVDEWKTNEELEPFFSGKNINFKFFRYGKNKSKNALKHLDSLLDENQGITDEIEEDSLKMIIRAYDNFVRLGYEKTNVIFDFEDWFNKNIIGGQ